MCATLEGQLEKSAARDFEAQMRVLTLESSENARCIAELTWGLEERMRKLLCVYARAVQIQPAHASNGLLISKDKCTAEICASELASSLFQSSRLNPKPGDDSRYQSGRSGGAVVSLIVIAITTKLP
jgi:hypothetical protein